MANSHFSTTHLPCLIFIFNAFMYRSAAEAGSHRGHDVHARGDRAAAAAGAGLPVRQPGDGGSGAGVGARIRQPKLIQQNSPKWN